MREVFNFDYGWKFRKESEIKAENLNDYFGMYRSKAKTGTVIGPGGSFYDDTDWKQVNLPHDWCIYEKFGKNNNGGGSQGKKPEYPVWYRKNFVIDKKYEGKKIYLKFDGIAIGFNIYLNSIAIGSFYNAYSPILCDITDFIETGRPCALAVRCDNTIKQGWWYEGGGIYRHVHLIITEPTHFADDGVYVCPQKTEEGWKVRVRSEIEGDLDGLTMESKILGTDKCVETAVSSAMTEQYIDFADPKLWDTETPNLYALKCTLYKNGEKIDEYTTDFGFREIKFDAEKGCFINGKPLKMKGVCLHHDHACVGVAVPDSVYDFRIRKLKEMGCNAIRTSHNPQAPAFYDACNRHGVVIMNENRIFSSTPQEMDYVKSFIRRDRNHPSVIMWSLLNEEPLQNSAIGRKIATTMSKAIKELDDSRAITAGCNSPLNAEGVVEIVDVMGFNYMQYGYDLFHKLFPKLPVFGSETGSYLTTRGLERTIRKRSLPSRYGEELYVHYFPWSDNPGNTWKYIEERDFVAGGFYWTGIDYMGEASPFWWPGVSSNFGAMDTCCFPKDNFYWHKAVWSTEPFAKIMPHWDFKEGRKINFSCYSNCEELEVYINGEFIGRFDNDKYKSFQKKLTYHKGYAEVIGFIGGKEVCRDKVVSAKEPVAIKAEIVKDKIVASSYDASIINLYAVDEDGVVVSQVNDEFQVSINDNGIMLGLGNGDSSCHYVSKENKMPFFFGCAQAIVAAKAAGEVVLTVKAPFGETVVKVEATEDTMPCYNDSPNAMVFHAFYMCDIHQTFPTYDELMSDFYYWMPTPVGYGKNLLYSGEYGYGSIRGNFTKVKPNKVLHIDGLTGDTVIYINAKKIGEYCGENMDVRIPMGDFPFGDENRLCIVYKLNGKDCGNYGKIYFK